MSFTVDIIEQQIRKTKYRIQENETRIKESQANIYRFRHSIDLDKEKIEDLESNLSKLKNEL